MIRKSDIDPLFGTENSQIIGIWDAIQRLQTDFCLPQELSAYYSSNQWLRATNVLDLGSGNGYYLMRLAEYFTDKRYHGVDVSQQFVAIARKQTQGKGFQFECTDLFDLSEMYDFVIIRLLLQHVSSVRDVLDKVSELTSPGGSALIIEAFDEARYFWPDLPVFGEFLRLFAEHQLAQGRDRRAGYKIEELLSHDPKWVIGDRVKIIIPSTLPGNLERFRETYDLWIKLFRAARILDFDFDKLQTELNWWQKLAHAYTQVGLNVVRLDRV